MNLIRGKIVLQSAGVPALVAALPPDVGASFTVGEIEAIITEGNVVLLFRSRVKPNGGQDSFTIGFNTTEDPING